MRLVKPIGIIFLCLLSNISQGQSSTVKEFNSDSISLLANSAFYEYRYKDAILYGNEILEKTSKKDSSFHKFVASDMISTIYSLMGDTLRSRIYGKKSLEIALKSNVDSLITWAYLNQGLQYTDSKQDFEKGIQLIEKSIDINETKKINQREVFLSKINLAWAYADLNKQDKAYEYLKEVDPDTNTYQPKKDYLVIYKYLLGRYYLNKNNLEEAHKELVSAARMVDEDSIADIGINVYESLTKYYKLTNNFEKAVESLEKQNIYNQTIYKTKQIEEIANVNAKFDLKEYQKNLALAEKDKVHSQSLMQKSEELNVLLSLASCVFILVIIGLLFLYKSRRSYIIKLNIKNEELENSKNKSEKLAKAKSQFLSTVSHELRTPLYGVIGISSILQGDIKLSKYKQELSSLKFSADYLLALINDVLLINKMDYQNLTLDKIPFKLSTIVNNVKRSFEYKLLQNNNKLIIDIDPRLPDDFIGSPVRISQILINLVGNATKFNENGLVWLNINLDGITPEGASKIAFYVKDNGVGIPKDKQDIIFEEFSQIGNENSSHKGAGLGLSIVKKLLKLQNSDIILKSELGKGSEFSFTLDLFENNNKNEHSNEIDSKHHLNRILNKQAKNLNILIVDDNKINQKVTQRILQKNHINSSVANNGEEAINLVKTHTYSLILMDINMPKIDGIKASKIIRMFNNYTPIVALTAVDLEDMRDKIENSGINDLLTKPYDEFQFLTTILNNIKTYPLNKLSLKEEEKLKYAN